MDKHHQKWFTDKNNILSSDKSEHQKNKLNDTHARSKGKTVGDRK